jgi:hypothetical protein
MVINPFITSTAPQVVTALVLRSFRILAFIVCQFFEMRVKTKHMQKYVLAGVGIPPKKHIW